MKTLYIILITGICINGYSQTKKSAHHKTKAKTANSKRIKTSNNPTSGTTALPPRETITEKYLKGPARGNNTDTSATKNSADKSPFAGGVHAAAGAGEKFDTTNNDIDNLHNVNNGNNTNVTVRPVAAANDTTFNANTINNNGVPTNSGAVDKSGNAQFGQSNWGNSRSTVGESQWTVPPPITASFSKEFPTAGNATWSRNNKDTALFVARYKSGDTWITTNYNASGQRLDMRTEVPLVSLPQAVNAYVSKLPANLPVTTISKWQVLGKADVYEIQIKNGKTIYVNSEGTEVNY